MDQHTETLMLVWQFIELPYFSDMNQWWCWLFILCLKKIEHQDDGEISLFYKGTGVCQIRSWGSSLPFDRKLHMCWYKLYMGHYIPLTLPKPIVFVRTLRQKPILWTPHPALRICGHPVFGHTPSQNPFYEPLTLPKFMYLCTPPPRETHSKPERTSI